MKKLILHLLLLTICSAFVAKTAAQSKEDFRSEKYEQAILEIVEHSKGEYTKDEVIDYLSGTSSKHLDNKSGVRAGDLTLNPQIAVVEYNENSTQFEIETEFAAVTSMTFSLNTNSLAPWAGAAVIDFATETIAFSNIQQNNGSVARSTSFIAININGTATDTFTAYIIQEPAPQPVLLVTPKFMTMPAEGGITTPFSVLNFNVTSWEVNLTPADWISIETQAQSSIQFDVDPNPNTTTRSKTIVFTGIGVNNQTVADSITVFQLADQAGYLVVSQTNIPVDPDGGIKEVTIFSNIAWSAEIVSNPGTMITDITPTTSTLQISVDQNSTPNPREAQIKVSGGDPLIEVNITIYQSAAYILLNPREKILPDNGETFEVVATRYFVNAFNLSTDQPGWVSYTVTSNDTFQVNVVANTGNEVRTAIIVATSASNPAISDTLSIFQYPANQPYIILSPREQIVNWNETSLSTPYAVTSNNVSNFVVEADETWLLTELTTGNDSLKVTLQENQSTEMREAFIRVSDASIPSVYDSVKVIQTGKQAYVLISPSFQSITHEGGQIGYNVLTLNVDSWEVITEMLPGWVQLEEIQEDTVKFNITANENTAARDTKFYVRDASAFTIIDSAVIYQKAAPASLIFASPRQQAALHIGNPALIFKVVAVNVQHWEVDLGMNDWLVQNPSTQEILSLNVSPNPELETRVAEIILYDTTNVNVADTVYVYQYSALDTVLLAAPREQWVGHEGTSSLSFDVTAVNIENWQVEAGALPAWIGLVTSTFNHFTLNVQPNSTLETRQALVKLSVTDHPGIYDSVFVYQYSALDTFLLAAPREKKLLHLGDDNVEFQVTSANVEAWQVETGSLPEWVELVSSTFTRFTLNVLPNNTLETRQALVRLSVLGHPDIYDSVFVYQYAGLDTFLLAAPREKKLSHIGNDNVDFQVTSANVETWQVETGSLPEWIELVSSTFTQFTLNVLPNSTLETRQGLIKLFVNDHPDIYDSVFIYQYSALDTFLLAAPREKEISYLGDNNVEFQVTSANVEAWQVETGSLPEWIDFVNSTFTQFTINVQPNNTLETRQALVKIFVNDHPDIYDSVFIYQFATPDPFLLAAPREQWVTHTETESVDFNITRVNVALWEVNQATVPEWIEVNASGQDLLDLKVLENESLQTRVANIFIHDAENASIMDSVWIYQYSALDTFLLAAPREQSVQFTGNVIDFHITSVNVSNWVIDPMQLPDWIEPGNSTQDILQLNVLLNESLQARQETVFIFSQANASIKDSVTIYQFAAEDPYILAAPREKKVGHPGDPAVDFDLTLVNVEEWEFVDTTIYEDWIDFENLGNKIRLSVAANEELSARSANIVIQESGNPAVRDSVSIYQYSALDQYILMEPREQLAQRYSGDTLYFRATRVNVDQLGFDVFDDEEGMIDLANTTIENDTLTVFVNLNDDPNSRQARIKVFDVDRPDQVSDTVSVYQNFPFIILRPSALDSLDWTGTVQTINSYSNVAQYTVRKGETIDWFQISKDSLNWSAQSLTLAGNDQFYLRVDSNNNSFLRRSSKLQFDISSSVATEFWFDQNTRPGKFYPVSGQVFVQNDPLQPLQGVSVVLYDSIVKTNASGTYTYQNVPENWIGTITPLIDTALAIPYYFLPPRIEISGLGIIDTTQLAPFAAYKIDPAVTLVPKTAAICFGETLGPGDPNYPTANITDTYGASTYKWTSIPPDSILGLNPNVLTPVFGPKETTFYILEVTNFFRTATDFFSIEVNQLPQAFSFAGELSVCRNQAGVIYQVPDPKPGVYYKWELDDENPGGVFANSPFPFDVSGNIAIINWGNNPGSYNLRLFAFNEFGCAANPVDKTIAVTDTEAPPPTTVERKANDNMLFSSDSLANFYQWGWIQKNSSGELLQEYIIPNKNEWYCRLPDGHVFNPGVYNYFVITYFDENACGSRSFFNLPVSIDEPGGGGVTIFPNPADGLFTVRFDNELKVQGGMIEMYDISGRMIFLKKIEALRTEEIIDLSVDKKVNPGIYMLVVRTPDFFFNTKIVIQ